MRLTKERIVLVSVLGAGVALLAVDKTLLGPSGASAATGDSLSSAGEAVAPAAGPATVAEQAGLADRLEKLVGGETWSEDLVAEALAVGEQWHRRAEEEATPALAEAPPPEDPAAVFARAHRLTAVMRGAGRPALAVIDGHPRAVGMEVEGFRVIAIDAERVVLERGDVRVELKVGRSPG